MSSQSIGPFKLARPGPSRPGPSFRLISKNLSSPPPSAAMETEEPEVTHLKRTAIEEEEEELRRLLVPLSLPLSPPSAVETNFGSYFAADFMKPGHDQYIYRHANGLCVVGLAPTHVAFAEEGGVKSVDFNVGKSDRSEMKATGKHKRNARVLEPNSALCKVITKDNSYVVRCCVKGTLLEVNGRLIKQPELLNSSADREGYIAIIMPKPADSLKIKDGFLNHEDYKKLKGFP